MRYYIAATVVSMIIAWIACEFSAVPADHLIFKPSFIRLKPNKKLFLAGAIVSAIPLTFLSAFRFNIGTDYWFTYTPVFLRILEGVSIGNANIEPGFYLINRGLQLFTDNPQSIFILTSLIIDGIVFYMIYRYSPDVPLGIFIFVSAATYFATYNIVRQMLAFVIVFFACKFIAKKQYLQYFIFVAIACSIHYSAVIAIPLIFILRRKYDPRFVLTLFAVIFLCMPAIKSFLEYFRGLEGQGLFFRKLYGYMFINDDYDGLDMTINRGLSLVTLFLALFSRWSENRQVDEPEDMRFTITLNVQYLSVLFVFVSFYMTFLIRYVWCFALGLTILLPLCIKREEVRWKRYVLTAAIILVLCFFCYNKTVDHHWHSVLPYLWVFNFS